VKAASRFSHEKALSSGKRTVPSGKKLALWLPCLFSADEMMERVT
jgi:hypothetical protein